ncbi:hypothetical protein [Kineococcus indalonis]|uniref:hypothetical protein n=1 Tax=Kineococcus indalonis TaxID=2696566 RepID=UPI00141272BF|nr:hypothetical protein [Kineococcus indalonis]NAZ87439.1 hypothetical protein [Kineococcus indalonis]
MTAQEPRPDGSTTPENETTRSAPPAFVAELSERVQQTRATIESATAAGEEELAAAHLGELEGLVDLAAAHDVALPDTVAYLAAQQGAGTGAGALDGPVDGVLDLTAVDAARCAPA